MTQRTKIYISSFATAEIKGTHKMFALGLCKEINYENPKYVLFWVQF